MKLVIFEINQTLLGMDVEYIQEVIKFSELTPILGAGNQLEGLIELRGIVIPVFDLHRVLQMQRPPIGTKSKIMIIEKSNYLFGFIVDHVREIKSFHPSDFKIFNTEIDPSISEWTLGIAKHADCLLFHLNIEKFFTVHGFSEQSHGEPSPSFSSTADF